MSHPLFGTLRVPLTTDIPAATFPLGAFPTALDGPKPSRELVRSVARFGVIEPVVLAEDPAGAVAHNGGRYRLIDGNRRVMASRLAGAEAVPAVVLACAEHPEELTLALNALRRDNPVTEYNAVAHAAARGLSESEIVRATGYPLAKVRARMRLAELEPELFAALAEQRVTPAVAETAAKLPKPLQRRLVGRLAETGALTAADVRELRQSDVCAALAELPLEIFSAETAHWSEVVNARLEAALAEIPETAEDDGAATLRDAICRAIDGARALRRAVSDSRHAA